MPLTVDLGVAELAATRFGVSPLGETVSGLQLLGHGRRPAELRGWASWARRELRRTGLRLPVAWPLVLTDRASFPEFLTPAPDRPEPTVQDELARMRATRAAQVRTSLTRVFGATLPADVAWVAAEPAKALREIADELEATYELLVAPHWPRLRAVLLADIAFRGRELALRGAADLLGNLGRGLSWQDGKLVIERAGDRTVHLGARGLVLVPTVLFDGGVRIKGRSSTQITLRYAARGAATIWSEPGEPPRSTVRLLGRPRAYLLELLRAPYTTGALADHLGVTPGAVSQHLGVLRDNGLVHTERTGRSAVHVLTEHGRHMLDGDTRTSD